MRSKRKCSRQAGRGSASRLPKGFLTSLDRAGLRELGFAGELSDLVVACTRRARDIGCDGVVALGQEAAALKDARGEGLLYVTPGIRPAESRPADDQKRVVTVEEAIRNGADYVVIGRPIRVQGTLQGLFLSG